MAQRRLLNLCLICGLWVASLLATAPAQALSEPACSAEGTVASVEPEVILGCLRAGNPVIFDDVTVTGDLDLTTLSVDGQKVIIANTLVISNSRFTGSVTAHDGDTGVTAIFQETLDLRGSQFAGTVDFTGAAFEQSARFDQARFESEAEFNRATFYKGASFNRAEFHETATFVMAENQRGFEFMDAQFFGTANFSRFHSTQNPQQPADVLFLGAQFTGRVFFMEAEFENQVHFNDAVFPPGETVDFSNTTFTALSLNGANFENGHLNLNGARYEKLLMDNFQVAILPPDTSEETLTALKDNFLKQGRLDIVNAIAYWQNVIKRGGKPSLTQLLETVLLDWIFGYGLKPVNAVRTSVILILLFSIFYYPEGVLRPAAFAPAKPRERKFTIRLVEIPIAHEEESAPANGQKRSLPLPPQATQAWRALVFSFGVFTKLSSGSTVAARARSLVIAEWIIGLMVVAGFLFSLANTNPLLRSVLDLLK